MSVDHRYRIKDILLGVSATLDDGVTAADILVMYSGGPENLRYLFEVTDYDAVITIDRPRITTDSETKVIQWIPIRYPSFVPIRVMAVDKTTVTATKLLEKIRDSMNSLVAGAALSSGYTIMHIRSQPMNQVIGGFDPLWRDDYIWRYRPEYGDA